MTKSEIEALAYEEAQRIIEEEFSYHNPYTRIIECGDVPFNEEEKFCKMVEDELKLKGESITRDGKYFKICRYQQK